MHQLTSHPSLDSYPIWSPDREWIAFASRRSGSQDLWIMPSAGGPARQLTSHPARDYLPTWSPAGDEIAFTSRRSGNPDIWVVPVGGGEPRQLTTDPAIDQFQVARREVAGLSILEATARPPSANFSLARPRGGRRARAPHEAPARKAFSVCSSLVSRRKASFFPLFRERAL